MAMVRAAAMCMYDAGVLTVWIPLSGREGSVRPASESDDARASLPCYGRL